MVTTERLQVIAAGNGGVCAEETTSMASELLARREAESPLRQLLYRACRELAYIQDVENCHSGLCATSEGKAVIEAGLTLLGVKDFGAEKLPQPPAEEGEHQ